MFTTNLRNFVSGESGAVTVDWVVLTAAIVGLGLAVMAVVSSGVENLSGDINTQLRAQNITTTFTGN
jgi:Flp pilus assembly pilin Flp